MSDQSTNPNNNTNERFVLNSRSLGVADSKEKDLTGLVLSQRDLYSAVYKLLLAVGLDQKDIRMVRVGATKEKKLKIITEVKLDAVTKKKNKSWTDFNEPSSGKSLLPTFCNALYNKAYHNTKSHNKRKHLDYKKVNREGGAYARIEFDPRIFIAFAYDIPYDDPFYNVSVALSNNFKDKKMKKLQKEYARENLAICVVYVTFRSGLATRNNDSCKLAEAYKEITNSEELSLDDFKSIINKYLSGKGFHPQQVDDIFDEYRLYDHEDEYEDDDDDE